MGNSRTLPTELWFGQAGCGYPRLNSISNSSGSHLKRRFALISGHFACIMAVQVLPHRRRGSTKGVLHEAARSAVSSPR